MSKKKEFKLIIQEFIEIDLPELDHRKETDLDLKSNKIQVLYGPRRSGKTFYFYQLIKQLRKNKIAKEKIIYINFEDDRILPLESCDLDSLIQAYNELYPQNDQVYFFFDEIQNISGWETFIRRLDDKTQAKIFITGSSATLLSKEIASSLRGRSISYPLFPLDFGEYLQFRGFKLKDNYQYSKQRFEIMKMLDEYLEEGGFPEIVLNKNKEQDKKILQEYFNSIVYRDLVDRYSLRNTNLLKDLLKHLFANITKEFSAHSYYKSIKQNMSVSKDTIYEYLSYIEEAQAFYFLPQFSYSLKEQRVNQKKIVCIDNGLRNRISFRFSPDTGKLAENIVGLELIKKHEQVFYYQGKQEVDFITQDGKKLSAINVSYGDEIDPREITGLLEFAKEHPKTDLILLTKDIEDQKDGIKLIPLWEWLLK
ncbi:MAG: ATP-binding protein [Cyanobacteria bacterium]|nr:ATP-binding protein [Cyanobacteriota bacterium]MDA1020670.1 ATP-binding protein [Cyanobacteriota bacterium]